MSSLQLQIKCSKALLSLIQYQIKLTISLLHCKILTSVAEIPDHFMVSLGDHRSRSCCWTELLNYCLVWIWKLVKSTRNGVIHFITSRSTVLHSKNKNLGLLSTTYWQEHHHFGSKCTRAYSCSGCFCMEIQQLMCKVLDNLGHILNTIKF